MKRNTAKEKHKRNRGFPYRNINLPWNFVNKRDTWFIVIKSTREVLDKFRNKGTAREHLNKWKHIVKEEVEIIKNERL